MRRMIQPFATTFGLCILVLGLLSCSDSAEQQSERQTPDVASVTVQFGWLFDAHHLGFIVARDKGIYRSKGVDVVLLPGGLDASPLRTLASGGADVAQVSGAEQLLSSLSESLPVFALAAFHQSSPHALISLQQRPVTSASDVEDAIVAVAFGDTAEYLLRDFMRENNATLAQDNLRPFRFDLRPLIEGDIHAVTGFYSDQPHTLRALGYEPAVLRYSESIDAGYGYMFVGTDPTSDKIFRFLEASREGWAQVFQRPDDALEVLLATQPELDREIERQKLQSIRLLMLEGSGHLAEWCIDSDVVGRVHDRMLRYGQLASPVEYANAIENTLCTRND